MTSQADYKLNTWCLQPWKCNNKGGLKNNIYQIWVCYSIGYIVYGMGAKIAMAK